MKLLTKEIEKKLPALNSTENISLNDKVIVAKFFNPCGAGTWYAVEYDPEEKLFFGYVELFEGEWGYFSLQELENIKLPFALRIERDMYFEPCKFSELNL